MSNENLQTPSHLLQNDAVSIHSPVNIQLPDPLELTSSFDENAGSSAIFSAYNLHSASNPASSAVHGRIITLPSPVSSAAPTPRDHIFVPVGVQSSRDNDEDLPFNSAAHMQSAQYEQQQYHQPQSPAAPNIFDRQISQPFAADLSPVPPAISPSSLNNHDPPLPRYSPLPLRSILKLESAIQASSAASSSYVPVSSNAPPRTAPQTSLAIITGY
jgi:hypothetical protein